MGSKRLLLFILVFVLLSASVSAVGFEWALGYPLKHLSYNPPDTWALAGRQYLGVDTDGSYFLFRDTAGSTPAESGIIDDVPFIFVGTAGNYNTRTGCGGSRSEGCQQVMNRQAWYKGHMWYYGDCYAECNLNHKFYGLADNVHMINTHANYKCDARDPDERCQDRMAYSLDYSPIITHGYNSVFVDDYTKSLGRVADLMKEDFSDNTTTYVGVYTQTYGDLLYWFTSDYDPDADYPGDELAKRETSGDDHLVVCTDLDMNLHCDHTQDKVQACLNAGGDWIARPGQDGVCCAEERDSVAGIATYNCSQYAYWVDSICGQDDKGEYHWAPFSEPGVITNLLGCPGYSVVSDGTEQKYCTPDDVQPKAFKSEWVEVDLSKDEHLWHWMQERWKLTWFDAMFGVTKGGLFNTRTFTNPGDILKLCRDYGRYGCDPEGIAREACEHEELEQYVDGQSAKWDGGTRDWPMLYCGSVPPEQNLMEDSWIVDGPMGEHGYICDSRTGYIFECTGKTPSYTNPFTNEMNIAPLGRSTADIMGIGGCPPKIYAYWTFDNSNAVDSINNFHGTLPDDSANQPSVVASPQGNAMEFDGTDVINLPSNFSVYGDKLTLEAWIKPSDVSGEQIIIEKDNSFSLKMVGTPGSTQATVKGGVNTGGGFNWIGDGKVSAGNWYHVALVYDGAEAEIFINGESFGYIVESGTIVNNDLPFVIGKHFNGVIDEVAVYRNDLMYFLLEVHSEDLEPKSYCGVGTGVQNLYCASDGLWTPDLDIKDADTCIAAGFGWTGNYCCSEDDDANEYYSDFDSPPKPLDYEKLVGDAVPDKNNPVKFELDRNGNRVTIVGPAKFRINTYSQEKVGTRYRKCAGGLLGNRTRILLPGEKMQIKLTEPLAGIPSDECRYRLIVIESIETKAGGGCWDKEVIPAGDLVNPKVVNFKGTFYGCDIPAGDAMLAIADRQINSTLFDATTLKHADCGMLLYARLDDDKPHAVCTPSGVWKFVADPDAVVNASVAWNLNQYNVSGAVQYGCCRPDQCWSGTECIDVGDYHIVDGKSYYCEE